MLRSIFAHFENTGNAEEKLFFFVGTKATIVVSGPANTFETKCRIHTAIRKHLLIIAFTTCPRTMKVSCSHYNSRRTPPFLRELLDSLKILTPHPHCYSPTCLCLQTIRKQQKYRSCSHQSCDHCKLLYCSSRSAVSADAALDSVESLCRIRIAIRKYILC